MSRLRFKILLAFLASLGVIFYGQKVENDFADRSKADLRLVTEVILPLDSDIQKILRALENQFEHYERAVFSHDDLPLSEADEKSILIQSLLDDLGASLQKAELKNAKDLVIIKKEHKIYSERALGVYSRYILDGLDELPDEESFELARSYNKIHASLSLLHTDIQHFVQYTLYQLDRRIKMRQETVVNIFVGKICFVIVLFIGCYLLIIRRLEMLIRYCRALAEDLKLSMPFKSRDEFGELGTSIDDLKKKVIEEQSKLQRLVQKKEFELKEVSSSQQSMSEKLSSYMPSSVYHLILSGKQHKLEERVRASLSIVVCQIEKFSMLTERVHPELIAKFLKQYHNFLDAICREHGVVLNRCFGHQVLAFAGEPETKGEVEDAKSCVSCALGWVKASQELNREWLKLGVDEKLSIKIAIHSGFATVGDFGMGESIDYTVIGSNHDLAWQLLNTAPEAGVYLTKQTYLHVKDDFDIQTMGAMRVPHKNFSLETFRIKNI